MVGGGGDGHDGLPRVAGADLDAEGEQVFSVQGRRWGEVEQLEPGGAEALRAQERSSGVGQDGPGAACFAAKRIVGFRPRDGVFQARSVIAVGSKIPKRRASEVTSRKAPQARAPVLVPWVDSTPWLSGSSSVIDPPSVSV